MVDVRVRAFDSSLTTTYNFSVTLKTMSSPKSEYGGGDVGGLIARTKIVAKEVHV